MPGCVEVGAGSVLLLGRGVGIPDQVILNRLGMTFETTSRK